MLSYLSDINTELESFFGTDELLDTYARMERMFFQPEARPLDSYL
jgi:hypothetical protein